VTYDLVTVPDQLEEYLASAGDFFGLDTETTGLNTRIAKLVGFSVSKRKGSGIYVPLGHRIGSNAPQKAMIKILGEACEKITPVFFNAKFDLNILQRNTGWVPDKWRDALELIYMADPDRKRKGLKLVAKEDLGFDMESFESLFTPEEIKAKVLDISTKSPTRCISYACADADATLRAWHHWAWVTEEQAFAVKVDHGVIDIVRKMEHNGGMELNPEYIQEQMAELTVRAETLREQIHRMAGKEFEIASPKQLGNILFEDLGIPSPGKTRGRNPQHRTGGDDLEKLAPTYPIVGYVIAYRKTVKAKDTYFKKLLRLHELGLKVRFSFNMFSAPTFRFSAPGGDPTKDGYTGVNIQAVSNGESRDIFGVNVSTKGIQNHYLDEVDEDEILVPIEAEDEKPPWTGNIIQFPYVTGAEDGNDICFRETCKGCPASCKLDGIDITRRIHKGVKLIPSVRQAFQAPVGYTLISVDYDRQELVIGANLSGEMVWLEALKRREDLHAITAAAAFQMTLEDFNKLPKDERKRKRDVGKMLNFAIFYGATAYSLAQKANLSMAVAEQIYDNFVRSHPTLFVWMNKVHTFARKNGYTTTWFGRKRWLKQFYDQGTRQMIAFANRSAVNTCIQGSAAEVTRIAMVRTDKKLKAAGFSLKDASMVMQLHDELTYLTPDEIWKDVLPVIKDGMEFNVKSWQVQLTTGAKIGRVWGNQEEVTPELLAA